MQNNPRIQSLQIMQALQPFTQLGLVSAAEAKNAVELYKKGDASELLAFTKLEVPNAYLGMLNKLKSLI